ncbi:MAG: DUF3096 domain-containing protein [Candidatus Pacearchaeota archaeon]|nr:DUF3096 domain-containing protein [Candidatus Pacearchaeota archaeon]
MPAISLTISAILAIILGVMILIFPRILRWAVGLYLLIFGVIQLLSNYVSFSPVY